jgi:hydroxymethylbilane synthase
VNSPLRVATRGSRLARVQAARVIDLLGEPAELVVVSSTGDQRPDVPIHQLGGTGVFVKEIEEAVLDGRADIAVHSAKDLTSTTGPGLVLAAVPERADPRDALVGASLDAVPTGGRIGTGSVRRRAQLAAARPDLSFGELRGNIETRIEKAAGFDAVVIAVAALDRLGRRADAAEVLEPDVLLPQVAQGALAVECRADDGPVIERLAAIDDSAAHAEVTAERAYLATLGGGCALPCGALARVGAGGEVALDALLASGDGRMVLRASGRGPDPEALGLDVARSLLDDHGGRLLLEEVA